MNEFGTHHRHRKNLSKMSKNEKREEFIKQKNKRRKRK